MKKQTRQEFAEAITKRLNQLSGLELDNAKADGYAAAIEDAAKLVEAIEPFSMPIDVVVKKIKALLPKGTK